MRIASGVSVFSFLILMLAISFSIPLHLFPLPNYIEEIFVVLSVVAGSAALLWGAHEVRMSICSFAWLVLGGLFLLSALIHPAPFVSVKLVYLVYWLVGGLALLVGEQVDWTTEGASDYLAWVMFGCALFGAVVGGLRHFGLLWEGLGSIVPKVVSDRMVGLIGHSNYFAYLCLVGYLSAAWLYHRARFNGALLICCSVLLLLGLLLSGSRSVLVAWGGLVALLWLRSRVPQRYQVVVSAGFIFTLCMLPIMPGVAGWLAQFAAAGVLDGRLMAIGQRGMDSSGRLLEWKIAFDIWRENPWFGIGIGNYAAASFAEHLRQGVPSLPGLFTHSHNSLLQLVVELGALGLIWVSCVGAAFCFGVWRMLSCRLLPISIVFIFSVYSLFEFPLWLMHFLVLNMLLISSISGSRICIRLRLGKAFSAVLSLVFVFAFVIYVPLVERFYWSFKQYLVRAPVKIEQYDFMSAMIRDPFMEPAGYMIYFANFQMSPKTLLQEREILERFRDSLPYPPLMARLAFIQVAMGDVDVGVKTAEDNRLFYGNGADSLLYALRDEAKGAFPDADFSVLFRE